MKGKSRAGIIAIIAAVGALSIYGVAHSKMQAASGVHILNSDTMSYTTDTSGCPGVNWKSPIAAGAQEPNDSNQITVDPKKLTSNNCQTTYTSQDKTKNCLVELSVGPDGAILSITGTSTGAPTCKTSDGGRSVILGAS